MTDAWPYGLLALMVLCVVGWVWGPVAALLVALGYLSCLLWAICLETTETTRRLRRGA